MMSYLLQRVKSGSGYSPVKINQISLDESGEHMGVCSEDGKVQVFGLYSAEEFHETFDCPIKGVKILDMISKQRITNVPRDDISLRPDMYPCSLCWKDNLTLIIGWGNSVKICSVKERHASEIRDLPNRYVEIVFQFDTEFYISGLAPICDQLVILSYVKEIAEKTEVECCARPRLDIVQPLPESYEEISSDALTVRGFQENECRDYHLEYSEGESLFYIISPRDVVVAKERDQDDHIDWLLEKKKYEEALMAAEISQKTIKKHKILDIGLAYINHLVEKGEYDLAARKCQKILGKNTELWEFEVYKFKEIGQLKAISPYLPRRDPVLKPLIYEMVLHEFLESDYEGFATLIKEWPGDLYNNTIIVQAVVDHLKKDPQNRTLLRTLAELYTYDQRYGRALEIYLTLRHKDVFQLIHKHNLFSSIRDKIVLLMDFDSEKAVDMLLDNEDKISIDRVVEELENRPELQHLCRKPFPWTEIKASVFLGSVPGSQTPLSRSQTSLPRSLTFQGNQRNALDSNSWLQIRLRYSSGGEYLHKLFKRDHHKGQRYHEKQISLYAEYDRPNLLPFLRDSTHCPLEKALEICQQRNFVEETVYLLSRMGNSRSALKMIMEELQDVDKAIEFAKEQDDGELWEDLILYSIDKPRKIGDNECILPSIHYKNSYSNLKAFITGLLNNIGTHVDPILLIHRIKEGMEIPNLRDSLVKILQDYNLQILLREGCKKILVADSLSLLKKMHRTQMKGVLVDEENICESCLSPILPSGSSLKWFPSINSKLYMKQPNAAPKDTSPEPWNQQKNQGGMGEKEKYAEYERLGSSSPVSVKLSHTTFSHWPEKLWREKL
ncbi:hypothetical protein DUI87_18689 [Hirundo rustica rustica]|uniref:Vps41 beta-propeller domain-containing protein n=1 Tax=Hirundo rustica rustica TaxID=333673 RepID=A0A3M0JWZ2_HIRRU|nr:hypothetical protein DUI87_18689 [Hirundo rustica rustica]